MLETHYNMCDFSLKKDFSSSFFFKNALKLARVYNIGVNSVKKIARFNPILDGLFMGCSRGWGSKTPSFLKSVIGIPQL